MDITTNMDAPEIINPYHLVDLILDGIMWLGIAIVGLLFIIVFYKLFPTFGRFIRNMLDRYLPLLVGVVWVMGFITYSAGMHLPVENNFFTVVPMSMIHATEMFFSISDISAIHQDCYNSRWFMTLYNICHFGAVLLSLVFIIRQFGYNLIEKLRIWIRSVAFMLHIGKKAPKNVYIFWGINDATYNLAKSISEKQTNSTIFIFVRTNDKESVDSESVGVSRFFKFFNVKNQELDKLRDIRDCYITSTRQRLSLQETHEGKSVDILRRKLGLDSLARIIAANKASHSHFFLLGDNQDSNVAATINLLRDTTVASHNVSIYCHARKSAKTQWLENYNYCHISEDTKVNIIDTAYLSIAQLKQNVKCHPVQHVEFDKNGRTESSFNSLVLGFGETGVEAVRFLYEFGSFVDKSGERSPFHCIVLDDNMTKKKGLFEAQTPGLKGRKEIELLSCPIDSEDYWNLHKTILPTLNYVIVCLGNDDITLETVANLCNYAVRCRSVESTLNIYVRSYGEEKNSQLKAMCSDISEKYKKHGVNVETFGAKAELFTYELVVRDKLLEEAKEYNYAYAGKKEKSILIEKAEAKGFYYKEDDFPVNICWNNELKIRRNCQYSIVDLEEIERRCASNFSNSLHAKTKIEILGKCGDIINPTDAVRTSLAMTEHERWNATMRLSGWQSFVPTSENHDNDPKLKLAPLICKFDDIHSWSPEMQAEYQGYDYEVVNTTIDLYKQEN